MRNPREKSLAIPPLHTHEVLPHARLNHAFALIYICTLVALFYHHFHTLLMVTTSASFVLHFALILSDAVLALMWIATQGFRLRPIKRKVLLENLPNVMKSSDYPALDVFICTADPLKEPPAGVACTALSLMAYDYPTEKLTIYVSDDGGSKLTLFALMEAAKFATHWLPFCREMNIMERSPESYFTSENVCIPSPETENIKMMYDNMKMKVETVVKRGIIGEEYITSEYEARVFGNWTPGCTRQDHPSIIQVLIDSGSNKDATGHAMPSLVYVSREKKQSIPHFFKAGALNVLLRVSAVMSNAPHIVTVDCDMRSNDPKAPLKALCFLKDPSEALPSLAFVQFPQRFYGINKSDIYASEHKRLFRICKAGMDGLHGPHYAGTGCFFRRRAFFGGPLSQVQAEIPELDPNHVVEKAIKSEAILTMANLVANYNYEKGTHWGTKVGIRYGSLVEDLYTGYRLLCQGWKTVLYDPADRAAFLGEAPINLHDSLSQERRWAMGHLEFLFCKYNPITFGAKSMGLAMCMCFSHFALWAFWSYPVTVYAFIPSLALLNKVFIFPEVSSSWFYLYVFLVVGAYGQDLLDFVYYGGTCRQWFNDQRMWMFRGVSAYLFASVDHLLNLLGMSTSGFNVTSKVNDEDKSKRYERGLYEFGVASPMFLPITTAAIINLSACVVGLAEIFKHGNWDGIFVQLCLSGFIVLNSWPIYEAIIWRADRGKLPAITTLTSIILAWAMYIASFLALKS